MAISIRGAREHNPKDISLDIGPGLTVVTGVSGSGKASLVFDTLYHEARRRFLEIYSLGSTASPLAPLMQMPSLGLDRQWRWGKTCSTATLIPPWRLPLACTLFYACSIPILGRGCALPAVPGYLFIRKMSWSSAWQL